MFLHVINSNSKGNAYLIKDNGAAFLIECGTKFEQIKEANGFNVLEIQACAITHEHQDHSRAHKQVTGCGIPLIASAGTFKALNIPPELHTYIAAHGSVVSVGVWKIWAINVKHDAAEPLGFIIEHPETGPILFLTDLYVLTANLSRFKFTTVIIEANYCEELAEEWRKKKGNDYVEKRRVRSHMSYQTTLQTLDSLDLSECLNIVLIHLSDGLTNAKEFKEKTEARYGISTTVADAGTVVDLIPGKY